MHNPASEGNPKAVAHFKPKDIEPTPEQLAIQVSPARVAIVEANAGASKTTVLALRMAEAWARNTRPEHILALTYTEAACQALKGALKKMGVPALVIQNFRIQTFEALCTTVLSEIEGQAVAVFTEAEQFSPTLWQAVQRVADNPNEKWRSEFTMPTVGDQGMVDVFVQQSEYIKGTMLDLSERMEQAVTPEYAASIGIEYTQLKIFLAFEKIRMADPEKPLFRGPNDATYDLAHILHDEGEVHHLRRWPSHVKVLMVDEMHDMNRAMFTLLKALLANNRCFFCGVGDVDQVIHKANGADARFMREEVALLTQHAVVKYPLTHSFRFSSTVAALAGKVAGKRYASKAPHTSKVTFSPYENDESCARQVVEDAKNWRTQNKSKMTGCSILLRHPHQSVQIENLLIEEEISYETLGFKSYVLRPEVLFVRGLLAVASDDLSSVTEVKTREEVMRALLFFSGSHIEVENRRHESQQDLLGSAIKSVTDNPLFLTSFFENQVLRNAPPDTRRRLQASVALIRNQPGPGLMDAVLAALHVKTLLGDVLASQRRCLEAAANLKWLSRMANRFDSPDLFFKRLNANELKQQKLKASKKEPLLLASIASVKGLEFDSVLMPYLAHGEFPDPHSDIGEETNTLYVGMTRVRKELTLYPSKEQPSSFMRTLDQAALGNTSF